MCGIGAVINGDNSQLEKILNSLKHRGYYDREIEFKLLNGASLGCTRLSIVDRENGAQPISDDTGLYAILNGEIYNHNSLRQQLKLKGYNFKTETDTEVLVHGFKEWGEFLVNHLDGQFAFVIYDDKKRDYLIARDPIGIKPLYYIENLDSLIVASEIKSLNNIEGQILELPPGTLMTKDGIKKYFDISNLIFNNSPIIANHKKLIIYLKNAVKKRVQTDLPIAVLLSGGIDSSAILALARKYHNNITVIIGVKNWNSLDSDAHHAIKYCQDFGIPFIISNPPTKTNLIEELYETIRIVESFEPNLINQSGLNRFLYKTANENGFKIALCGEGADEIFYGYPEFKTEVDKRNLSYQFLKDLYRTQLQRVDRTSMNYEIEVRVPFLDIELLKYVTSLDETVKINQGVEKWILRESLKNILPDYIVNRKKVVLSEGMGYEGNVPNQGIYSSFAKKSISQNEFEKYQNEFPNLLLTTKEEVLFLKTYLSMGYPIINQKRPYANQRSSL